MATDYDVQNNEPLHTAKRGARNYAIFDDGEIAITEAGKPTMLLDAVDFEAIIECAYRGHMLTLAQAKAAERKEIIESL